MVEIIISTKYGPVSYESVIIPRVGEDVHIEGFGTYKVTEVQYVFDRLPGKASLNHVSISTDVEKW